MVHVDVARPFEYHTGQLRALTYDDETVVVLTDYGNRPYTLYYDGSRDRITGFGLDASLVSYSADTAAFSEAASE